MNEKGCTHRTGRERRLETENFVLVVVRCNQCGEFVNAKTSKKRKEEKES